MNLTNLDPIALLQHPFVADVLIEAGIKTTLVLAMTALATAGLRQASAALRHRVWCLGLIAACMIPCGALLPPQWRLPVLPAASTIVVSVAPPASTPTNRPTGVQTDGAKSSQQVDQTAVPLMLSAAPTKTRADETSDQVALIRPAMASASSATARNLLASAWMTGTLLFLTPLFLGLAASVRQARRSQRMTDPVWTNLCAEAAARLGLSRSVTLRQTEDGVVPMTSGVFFPVVYLPRDSQHWTAARRRLVLLHELAHVKRWDVLFQALARLACAIYWFHPLAWYALRNVRIESESACDDCVVGTGERVTDYAAQLIDIARAYRRPRLVSGVAITRSTQLEGRIVSLLDRARSHQPVGKRVARGLLAGALITVLGLSVIGVGDRARVSAFERGDTPRRDNDAVAAPPEDIDREAFAKQRAAQVAALLPPTTNEMADRTAEEVREIVTKYAPEQITPEFREALTRAIATFWESSYPDKANQLSSAQRDEIYLNLPMKVRTFQWKLFMALRRRPLDGKEQSRLDAQQAWLLQHIRSLPALDPPFDKRNLHADKVAELKAKFANPLVPVFHEPLTSKQFAAFQKEMKSYDGGNKELLFVVPHAVWADLNARFPAPQDVPIPELTTWTERPQGYGQGNGVIRISFPSAERVLGNRNVIGGYRKHQHVIDLKDVPPGLRGVGDGPRKPWTFDDVQNWFAKPGRGQIVFDAQALRLIGMRGTRLMPLETKTWIDADSIPTEKLIAKIEKEGAREWSLPQPIVRDAIGGTKYDAMAAALTSDGELYVFKALEHDAGGLSYHVRRHQFPHPADTSQPH
ncbi:Regulatory protein BlaR1 [Symmachiella macrocystis]|uniref:Regulatory protein BlaR1 n=1 Tax=Symmachiella macrocystis TaxID=2527985 RepID=A0A5C6AST8_9PLAN|nr:M56 family metallopeptidase [Symmachiella macrocystis]TWU03065.1 Regulatory protein BlaR1 [Symmachiella macrocystis]